MRWLTLSVALIVAAFCHSSQAAITVDPNNIGATDVIQFWDSGTPVPMTNPLPDPLVLGGEWIAVGDTAAGELRIDNGSSVLNGEVVLGYQHGSTGVMTVEGSGSSWTDIGELVVGYDGHGGLMISGGGTVESYCGYIAGEDDGTGTGEVIVDGPSSSWTIASLFQVGSHNSGKGTLTISDGGTVESGSYARILSGSSVKVEGSGSTWTSPAELRVTGGTFAITNGGKVSSLSGSVAGVATVSGPESAWTIQEVGCCGTTGGFDVGAWGDGVLHITDGGMVSVERDTWVANNNEPHYSGEINFDNGTFTTGTLLADFQDLTGQGTIYTHGLVSNVDLVFDASHGLSQTILLNENPGQDITLHLDVDGTGSLGAGYRGTGTMRIADGVVIESYRGFIGVFPGSTGTVSVDGVGSAWNVLNYLGVGYGGGNGSLNITGGGIVNAWPGGSVGGYSGNGTMSVDGIGSTWNSRSLYVGSGGTITISRGGLISVGSGSRYGLTIAEDLDGDSYVNIASGGMLALNGVADGSIFEFLDLVEGTDAIRYRHHGLAQWQPITVATEGVDYTLEYLTEGDLSGYTKLTVGVVPESPLLDIKPGSDPNEPNPVNLKSKGVLPVAILGTDEFDVTDVDLDSLLFGDPLLVEDGGSPVSPLRCSFEDITDDGLLDLSLKFSMRDLVELGAIGADTEEMLLVGDLLDGTPFEGADAIRIVPPNGNLPQIVANVPEPTAWVLLALFVLAMLLHYRLVRS